MLKFLVVSDLHLVAAGGLCNGLDPAVRLDLAIDHVNARHADAAFCVFAGDLADHDHAEAYAVLKARLERLAVPCYLTLGNHDNRDAFAAVFGAGDVRAGGRAVHAIDAGDYRVLVLDSAVAGSDEGWVGADQFAWLGERLNEAPSRPVIIVLHHSIAPLGVPTDNIALQDRDALAEALASHDIRQVISGHVHMPTAGVYRRIPFTTISGSHYKLFPQLFGTVPEMPRFEGPGQLGVVLAGPDGVVVHHESFLDRHPALPTEFFG